MPKVFCTIPGAAIRIGNFGACTYDRPLEVPADVAAKLDPAAFRVAADGDPEAGAPPSGLNGPMTAWHAKGAAVHHTEAECTLGNNIETANRKKGIGGKPLCEECSKIRAAKLGAPQE